MTEYPKRPSHYAHRYCRLLAKTCAAQEITALGCWLCTVIAHLEDSRRYTGPISFYNEQLAPLLGVKKWETLERARRLAVDHGWLAYQCGGRHKPGYYHVTIPPGLEGLDDAPCDESSYPKNGYLEGDQGESRYPKNGYNRGISADTTGEQEGGSFFPSPIPSPKKSTTTRKNKPDAFRPPTLDEVAAYCKERRNSIDPEAFIASYQKTGWRTKNNVPIKDWKACIITWEKYDRRLNASASSQAEGLDDYAN